MSQYGPHPVHRSYDVVIVGGAMMGASVAWHLARDPDFDGRVLVVERDPSHATCSTAHTNSCMRQQFSSDINVRISQYAADYVKHFREEMGDPRVPDIQTDFFGYLYLAANEPFAAHLRKTAAMQAQLGAATRVMTADDVASTFPFLRTDDLVLATHNPRDEGYFDAGLIFEWWRRLARERGVEFTANEVVAVETAGPRVAAIRLASGERIGCQWLVNAAGPRAAGVAAMAGRSLPVEPRKRYTWVFEAERPLDRKLPLTIDPTGVHVRSDGAYYMAGATPDFDPAVEPDDFAADLSLWETKAWPAIAHRIPAFEAIRVVTEWVGHYAFNTLDQNAVVGPDDEIENFLYVNGFSGHGIQQAPAMGRGLAEWITTGRYRTLDLSPLGIDRIRHGGGREEAAII